MDKSKTESALSGEGLALSSRSGDVDLSHSGVAGNSETMDHSMQLTSAEMIELGRFDLVDELNAPLVAARPKPRGMLPVPTEVEAAVAEDDALLGREYGIVPTSEDRQRQLNSLTLQYYYGGHDVAYRVTPEGVELLADGLVEIRELTRCMSQEELLTIKIGQP
jgi:hypothetical protein